MSGLRRSYLGLIVCLVLVGQTPANAAPVEPPNYATAGLDYIFPAGGSRGTSVTVTLGGISGCAASDNLHLVIDGPGGIEVEKVTKKDDAHATAVLQIAADAPLGRRAIRLAGGQAGLTNFCPFFVSSIHEHTESTKNNDLATAEAVNVPAVINGRIERVLDVDCFRFQGTVGQQITAALVAHRLDSKRKQTSRDYGYADASLELLDTAGRVIADAEDTIGLDPVLQATLPADGEYIARVKLLDYGGSAQAVYRLTLGDVPHCVTVFPPGGQRGSTQEFTFAGPGTVGLAQTFTLPESVTEELLYILPESELSDGYDLPIVLSNSHEVVEVEPNDTATAAQLLEFPVTVNAQANHAGDEDCFALSLQKGESIRVEVLAQRLLNSPADTRLEVLDPAGEVIAANDDSDRIQGWCAHDFVPFDSELAFTCKKAGQHTIRVIEQKGAAGPDVVYRLRVERNQPGFQLYQWPDAVPVWGPGTTSAFVVEVERWGAVQGDIELRVEGLPANWLYSCAPLRAADYATKRTSSLANKSLITITAPADAQVGEMVPFRVTGTLRTEAGEVTQYARPLTLYQEFGHQFRISSQARSVVAPRNGPWLEVESGELALSAKPGDEVKVPLVIHYPPGSEGAEVGVVANRIAAAHHKYDLNAPVTLKPGVQQTMLTVKIPASAKGETVEFLVARAWRSDVRAGLPGPCTQLIRVDLKTGD